MTAQILKIDPIKNYTILGNLANFDPPMMWLITLDLPYLLLMLQTEQEKGVHEKYINDFSKKKN